MIIANPIYDTVFKKMMENERVVKFFIGTLLGKQIEAVEAKPQEITYTNELKVPAIFRLDFIATIKTNTGELSKVLIEIQNSQNKIDIMRFRLYLGEQYKKEDIIENKKAVLPITTIYILGYPLPEFETACVKVGRVYEDLINETVIERKSEFAESLTHESYIVQVSRISNRYQTSLDKLLSIFEQTNFVPNQKRIKEFTHPTDTEDMKNLTNILHYCGTNAEEQRQMEMEEEVLRSMSVQVEDYVIELEEKEKELGEKDKVIEEKDKELKDTKKALEELSKRLAELERNQNKK